MDLLTLVAKVTFDDAEYQAGLAKMQKDANVQADKMRSGLLKATGAGVAALGAFAASSVKTGADFDSSMSQVAATMGKTMGEMESEVGTVDTAFGTFSGNLREYAQFMGSNTAFSAKQAADALNYMALAGYDTQTSMNMLPNVLNLAAAGGMDLATASDMVTDAQTALNLKTEETSQMVDKMAMAASKSNTSVSQLGEAYLALGATGRNLAGGTTELSTVLGVLADNGIKGSEGGTKLRNVILSLQTPTKEGTEALKKMGMTYDDMYDSAGNMRALPDIFAQMQGAMEGMTQAQKDAIVQGIFNRGDMAAINALLGTKGERYDELAGYIDNAAGSAQKMADTQLDNLEGDITLLKSAFEGLQIQVADKLMPAFRKGVKTLTEFITNIEKYIPIITGAAAAFGTFAVAVNIVPIIQKVTVAAKALWAVFTTGTGPIGLVIAAIAGLVTWFITMYNTNEEFRAKVDEVWANVKEVIGSAVEAVGAFFERAKQFFADLWTTITEWWAGVLEWFSGIGESIQGIFEIIGAAVQVGVEFVANIFTFALELLTVPWRLAWESIQLVAELVWSIIGDTVTNAMNAIWSVIQSVMQTISNFITTAWNAISTVIQSVMKTVSDFITIVWNAIKGVFETVLGAIHNVVTAVFNAIKTVIMTVFNAVATFVSTVWNGIKNTIATAIEAAKSKVDTAVEGIKTSIKTKLDSAKQTVTNILDNIKKAFGDKMEEAHTKVKNAIEKIKSVFNFTWKLPHLKLPHISISGEFSLMPPSAPHFSIDWYKKAYDNIFAFSKPTVIPTAAGLKGFGDGAGTEYVMGENKLKDLLHSAGNVEYNQTVNIYSPRELSPWETARQTKNATRELLLNIKNA